MFDGPNDADIARHGGLLAHLFGDLRKMADDGRDSAATTNKDNGFEGFKLTGDTAVRSIEEGGKGPVRVLAHNIVKAPGESGLRFKDEDEIIDFAFAALGIRGHCKRMVIEKGDAGDTDEDVLASGPAERGRDSNLDTIIGEEFDMALFALESADEVGQEE